MAENTCTKVEEETQQVTDSSQGRVVTSNGKLRPMSTLSSESGYHEGMQQVDSANKDQLLYIQDAKQTFNMTLLNMCGAIGEQVGELLQKTFEEGMRQGRKEGRAEVEREAADMVEAMIDSMNRQFGKFMQDRSQSVSKYNSAQVPTGNGTEEMFHPEPTVRPFLSCKSMSAESSEESCAIVAREETGGYSIAADWHSSRKAGSFVFTGSEETLCENCERRRRETEVRTPRSRSLSSSEAHPRKILMAKDPKN